MLQEIQNQIADGVIDIAKNLFLTDESAGIYFILPQL